MKRKKQFLHKAFAIILTLVIMLSWGAATPVSAASTTTRVPITCYTLNGRVNTYTNSSLSKYSGYIASNDKCTILQLYSNGAVKVKYPAGKKMKTAFAPSNAFFSTVSFSGNTIKLGSSKKVYIRSNSSSSIGTAYASDSVVIINNNGRRTQIIYPVSGGYKMGWIDGVYGISVPTANPSSRLTDAQIKSITFNAIYYANRYPDLKAAFGYNETLLYNHWISYGIKEGRVANSILDLGYYLRNNTDLVRAFGSTNYTAAYNHFITYGYNEGRFSSDYYCGSYYKNRYSDLCRMSYYDLIIHYLSYGISEKRWANSSGKIPESQNATSGTTVSQSGWQWPVTNYYVCGNNWSTYYSKKGKDHLGVDIKSTSGDSNIYAASGGTVAAVGWNNANGNSIVLKHNINGKTVYTFYGHLSSICIKKGSSVSKGQKIGVIGTTGSGSTGIHLHFAITTQCSLGTWGYGTTFPNAANTASYQGYTFYSPTYVIGNNRLP